MGVDVNKKNKKRTGKRKGKKLWRNVDVTDYVDNAKLAGAPNSELFVIDKSGKVGKNKVEKLTKEERKQKNKNKLLYQDSLLSSQSLKKETFDPVKNTSTIVQKLQKNINKEKLATENKTKLNVNKKEEVKGVYDIWSIPKEEIVKTPKIYEKRTQPKVLPSKIAEEISAGISYRPTTEDHQKLLGQALEQLTKKQDNEDVIRNKLSYPSHLRNESKDMEVKIQFSDDEDEEEEKEEIEVEEDEQTKREKEIRKHYSMKLTQTQLNKRRKIRVAMAERRRAVALKRRMQDIDRIPAFQKMIEKRDEERRKRLELRALKQSEKESQPDRLGKYPFQEKSIDFLFSDQIPSSLRTLKSTGSIAVDVYKDFQKRNILEPRVRVNKRERRYKLKSIQKRDVKEWEHQFNSTL